MEPDILRKIPVWCHLDLLSCLFQDFSLNVQGFFLDLQKKKTHPHVLYSWVVGLWKLDSSLVISKNLTLQVPMHDSSVCMTETLQCTLPCKWMWIPPFPDGNYPDVSICSIEYNAWCPCRVWQLLNAFLAEQCIQWLALWCGWLLLRGYYCNLYYLYFFPGTEWSKSMCCILICHYTINLFVSE